MDLEKETKAAKIKNNCRKEQSGLISLRRLRSRGQGHRGEKSRENSWCKGPVVGPRSRGQRARLDHAELWRPQ